MCSEKGSAMAPVRRAPTLRLYGTGYGGLAFSWLHKFWASQPGLGISRSEFPDPDDLHFEMGWDIILAHGGHILGAEGALVAQST